MDADKLKATLHPLLQHIKPSSSHADEAVEQIVDALAQAIDASTPWSRPTDQSKPGFTPECRQLQREAKKAHRDVVSYQARHQAAAPEELQHRFSRLKRLAQKKIQRYRNQAHLQRITDAANSGDARQIWNLSRWARDRSPYQAYTPPIKAPDGQLLFLPEQKADALAESFFAPPPTADLSDLRGYRYPRPANLPPISAREVRTAIMRPGAFKAPGTDDIPNRVLQASVDQLAPLLADLFNVCLTDGYCPRHFREARTIALRKPGKSDYSIPKSYRPIALLNTIGKALEGIMATRIGYLAETHHLLPNFHFGGRKGQGTDVALHAVTEAIRNAWKRGKVASVLLDISGAFDNTSHRRLLHNLRKRRIHKQIIAWIESFLSESFTTLELPEYCRPRSQVPTGIPQGSHRAPAGLPTVPDSLPVL